MYISGDNLQPVGNVYGFPSVSRISGTTPVVILHEDPGRLGVVRLVVSLFIGDTGAIDMDRSGCSGTARQVMRSFQGPMSPTLVCPNWTISGKYNMLPVAPRILMTGWSPVNNSR